MLVSLVFMTNSDFWTDCFSDYLLYSSQVFIKTKKAPTRFKTMHTAKILTQLSLVRVKSFKAAKFYAVHNGV
jgi:hypothetical protein